MQTVTFCFYVVNSECVSDQASSSGSSSGLGVCIVKNFNDECSIRVVD